MDNIRYYSLKVRSSRQSFWMYEGSLYVHVLVSDDAYNVL